MKEMKSLKLTGTVAGALRQWIQHRMSAQSEDWVQAPAEIDVQQGWNADVEKDEGGMDLIAAS